MLTYTRKDQPEILPSSTELYRVKATGIPKNKDTRLGEGHSFQKELSRPAECNRLNYIERSVVTKADTPEIIHLLNRLNIILSCSWHTFDCT